jgi:gliding motility-associated-like protein
MRIFTLGKNGIPLFFFALFLFSGTTMYGQEDCPTTGGTPATQDFCYLDTVGDIVTDGTAVYQTNDNANDTQPIPQDEVLTNGETYYVGAPSGDCERIAVTVTVEVVEAPTNTIFPGSNSFEISPCVTTSFTADDLASYFQTTATGYDEIEVYTSEFGTTVAEGELVAGESYFVAQVSSDPSNCPSIRAAVGYNPISAGPPAAPSPQVFCEGATVADLQANGTYNNTQAIRWYRSLNATTPLAEDTQLINGQTYYASQIVNDRNDPFPPCESDRTAVIVELTTGDAGSPNTGVVCETEVQETFPSIDAIRNYLLGLLDEGVSGNGTFNPTPAQLAQQYQNDTDGIGDYTTTYTLGEDECEASVLLTISVVETEEANAGGDVSFELSVDDEPKDLYSEVTEGANTNGYFVDYPDGMFDPAQEGAGVYTITYTVDETSGCISGTDSATFTITVTECEANAGEDVNETFCRTEVEALVQQIINAQNPGSEEPDPTAGLEVLAEWLGDRDLDGTFEGDFSGLQRFLVPGIPLTEPVTVTGTYIVGEGDCVDTASISIRVIEDANAGNDNAITLSPNDDPVDLFTLLGEDAQTGGSWSSGNGTFNPATDAAGTYTYTVGSGDCTDSASVVVTLTTNPVVSPGVSVVCLRDVQTFFPSVDEIRKYYLRLLPSGVATNGSFSPTPAQMADIYQADEDGLGEFTTTYTVNGESYDLTINVVTEAEAGDDATITLTTDDEPVDLLTYLGENALRGGTWNTGNGIFDPATDEAGDYTYTVGYETCMDSATVTVVVTDTVDPCDAGSTGLGVVCLADVQTTFPSVDEVRKYYLSLLESGVSRNGTFNPTPAQMVDQYQNDDDQLGDFTTTYTVVDGECSDSVELTIRVVEDADAGEDGSVTLNENDDPVNLFDYLGGSPDEGGTWSSGNGIFDPSTDEPGTFTYSIGTESCMDTAAVIVTVTSDPTDPCSAVDAGSPGLGVVCSADVQAVFPSNDEIRKYYLNLLDPGVARNGTFSPTPAQMAAQFQNDEDGLGDFTTTYTIVDGECSDSVSLTIRVVEDVDAGEDGSITLNENGDPVNLFNYLGGTPDEGGTWSPGDGTFDPATDEPGTFTYSIGSESCLDTAIVTVTVTSDPCEGVVDAGTDTSITICETDVENTFSTIDNVTSYYLGLLDSGIATTGTFDPSLPDLLIQYTEDEDGLGEFSTTYTLTEGDCTDSVELTVNIIPLEEADAGTINDFEVCTNENTLDLYDYLADDSSLGGRFFDADGTEISGGALDVSAEGEFTITYTVSEDFTEACVTGTDSTNFTVTVVPNTANAGADNSLVVCNSEVENLSNAGVRNLYLSLLEDGIPTNGTFEPTIQQIIEQYNFTSRYDDFTTIYTVGTGNCTDSVELTVTVLENPDAGQDATVNLEEDATATVDLFDELGGTPDAGGTWTFDGDDVDATFDPATDAEGVYTYTVTSENGCSDSATVTVIVGTQEPGCTEENTPAAPTVVNFDGCVADGATIADLQITGEDGATFTVYSDETLQTEVGSTEVLTEDTYYVTQTNATGCVSDAATITVTLSASDAPTLVGNLGCIAIDSTIADLEDNVSANGDITWYATATSTDPLSRATTLVDGTTYYATSTNSEGCESSERLAVTVDFCPIVIPEIFTPNGDGINDNFVIRGISTEYPGHTIEIYNRWGKMVYNGKGENPGWDGTSSEGSFGNGVLPVGVYFYILYYNDGQTAPTQGKVYLSR